MSVHILTLEEQAALRDARNELAGQDDWRTVRCQTCYGIGAVKHGEIRHALGNGLVKPEDVGEGRECPDCEGYGVPVATLLEALPTAALYLNPRLSELWHGALAGGK